MAINNNSPMIIFCVGFMINPLQCLAQVNEQLQGDFKRVLLQVWMENHVMKEQNYLKIFLATQEVGQ